MKVLLPVILSLALAGPAMAISLPSWLDSSPEAEVERPPRPVVTSVLEGHGEAERSIPGVVQSKTQVTMAFQTLGRMIVRHVDLGDRVEKGDVLAELASEDLEASTRAAQAAADAAEVQRQTAQMTLERTQALARSNVASNAQLEQAQRAAAAAEAGAQQAQSELLRAQDAQGFARMTAPFSGVVSAVFETPGAVVSAGAPVLQLSTEDQREVVIDLPEYALASLPENAEFTVWQRTDPENEISASVNRIDPLADTATRTRRLYLTLPENAPFRLGSLVRARLGSEGKPVLTIPAIAIFQLNDNPHVWRVTREGESAQVNAVPIKHSNAFQGMTVVEEGLQPGDEIVTRGIHSLSEGQAVGRRVDP